MAVTEFLTDAPRSAASEARRSIFSPGIAQLAIVTIVALAALAGFLATDSGLAAQATADADLTRLMRAMTAIKGAMVAGATAAVLWRLNSAVTAPWFLAYGAACGAMAAGPGLIWNMAHLGAGAILLHGGLVAAVILVWRDPEVSRRLEALVVARRIRARSRG